MLKEDLFADLQGSVSVQTSTLPNSVLQVLAALVSVELSSLTQEVCWATRGFCFPVLWPGASLRKYSWEVLWLTHLSHLSGIVILRSMMS